MTRCPSQNRGAIAEAEAKRSEIATRFLALQSEVIAEIDTAMAEYTSAREQVSSVAALMSAQKMRQKTVEQQYQQWCSFILAQRRIHLRSRWKNEAR